FQPDNGDILRSETTYPRWGPCRPEYGDTSDDNALEAIMQSVRYDRSRLPGTIEIRAPLSPGEYLVQLLFSDNFTAHHSALSSDRGWIAIEIEGAKVVEQMRVLVEQQIERSARLELLQG